MNPGRALDALLAKKIMEWKYVGEDGPNGEPGLVDPDQIERMSEELPKYSTDISAAWEVVEKIKEGKEIDILYGDYFQPVTRGGYCGQMMQSALPGYFVRIRWGENMVSEQSQSAPHAICLAALKGIGFDV